MNESMKIECEWWGSSNGETDLSQVCRGAIGIHVGEDCLTRLEDAWGNTVRNRLNASAHTLAAWFAGNWWRLRWEPETPSSQRDVDWRLSHSMASAGEGYCWPNILFASDGDTLAVASRATRGRVMGPVRYLNDVNTRITAKAFESGIDAFLTLVLSRLHSEGHGNSELAELWAEVQKERGDVKLAQWRRLEAICGFDPGEAPPTLIEMLVDDQFQLGRHAVEEVAAHSRHETAEALESIRSLTAARGRPLPGGFRCNPQVLKKKPRYQAGMRPWQKAAALAGAARAEWNLGKEPVSNMYLADILRTPANAFSRRLVEVVAPLPVALRDASGDNMDMYIGRKPITSRRFAASRLLAQWLDREEETERLIPAGDAKTAQQQFQRAFAQEFLCPFNLLMERLQTEYPTGDAIEDAADYFGVSQQVVRTTLVNKEELDREALNWSTRD